MNLFFSASQSPKKDPCWPCCLTGKQEATNVMPIIFLACFYASSINNILLKYRYVRSLLCSNGRLDWVRGNEHQAPHWDHLANLDALQ
jgi:hypothetical protein